MSAKYKSVNFKAKTYKTKMSFIDVPVGQYFVFHDKSYMKVLISYLDKDSKDQSFYAGVNLDTGEMKTLNNDTVETEMPVQAKAGDLNSGDFFQYNGAVYLFRIHPDGSRLHTPLAKSNTAACIDFNEAVIPMELDE